MRKILTYGLLIANSLLVIAIFITSKTFTQLAIATLLYPPLVYFIFKYIPGNPRKVQTKKPTVVIQPVNSPKKEAVEIVDIDKRTFLKLVGAAGFSFFLFSILTRRIEALILSKIPGSGVASPGSIAGNEVNPTEPQPSEGYKISEIVSDEFTYYGFTKKNGGWYVMKEDPTKGSFRYAKGESNFPKNWSDRERLKYDYFYNVFQ